MERQLYSVEAGPLRCKVTAAQLQEVPERASNTGAKHLCASRGYRVTFVLNRVSGTSVVRPECSSGLSRPDEEGQERHAVRLLWFRPE